MAKRKRKRRLILIPVYLTICLLGVVISAYFIKEYKSRNNLAEVQAAARERTPKNNQQAKTVEPWEILPRFQKLAAQNPDMVGWLTIPDTNINYPVMYKTGDNDYYLEHDFEGNPDQNGLLVLDKRCLKKGNDLHNLIHGHNMKSGAMFGELLEYSRRAFYLTHKTINFSNLYEERTYDIVGVFRSTVNDENTEDLQYYNYISLDNKDEFNEYIQGVKDKSLYDTGVSARFGDRLITLSTCENSRENGRLVVVARSRG